MRIVSLAVEDFRAIRRASLDLGRGLNVLHGPNDLGKSTLACSIRAALLVVPNSSEADTYRSWFSGSNPRVELVFVDGDEHWWKVRKTFGTSSGSSAELLHSKDGLTFSLDCKARQVEERLRVLLAWGVPAPGGKGAPRGVPRSFLANVLLGDQVGVDDILSQSIADDPAESGKLRLSKALASLAQDPLLKEVLARAQREVDLLFTDSGRQRRGQSSPFTQASERVKAIVDELDDRRRQLVGSSAIEVEVARLREQHSKLQTGVDEAAANLVAVEERVQRGIERRQIEERVASARTALDKIDAQRARLAQMTVDLEEARARARVASERLDAAVSVTAGRGEAHNAAAEAVRAAGSQDAARELDLRRAQIEKQAAEAKASLAVASALESRVGQAIEARNRALEARRAVAAASQSLDQSKGDRARAVAAEQELDTEMEAARALIAYVRWRASAAASERSGQALADAQRSEEAAAAREGEAERILHTVSVAEERLAARAALLPPAPLLQAMMALERDLEKAGAALGGGLSVVLQPVRALEVTARADDREESVHRVSAPRAFEADRAMRLSIDGVAAFEIAVGSAEARRAVDALRERWRTEAIPVLEKAGVDRLSALGETAAALAGERAQLAERRRSADQLRSEAKNLRQQAAIRRDGAASPSIGAEEIEARRTAIGAQDLATLEARWMALKKAPERTLEQLHEALQRRHREQRERVGRLDEQMRLGAIRVEELSDRAREAESLRQDRAASLPPGDLDALAAKAAADVDSSKRRCAALEAQEKNVSNEAERTLEKVESTLAAAATALEQARVAEAKARSEMSAENSRCNAQEGALGLLRDQVDGLDRPKAESDLRTLEAALAAIPPGSVASAEELAAAKTREREARRVHGEVREALMAREGALTHVGGAALREDVQRLEEARAVAEAQERALEVDAQAWKLLRETLREVENEEGTHLGRALAGPVTTRFEELTRGRYQGFRLDQALRAETIEAVGAKVEGQDVLASLSVGTRSQLATLVRLTVADQLKTTIVLDDHLVHTDVSRLEWFHDLLRRIAVNAQIIVITCRPQDYLAGIDVPVDPPVVDLASGLIRSIDLRRILERHASR